MTNFQAITKTICFYISLLIPINGATQVASHITNYTYKSYSGGLQNWGVSLSEKKELYVGNNNGLLRYNGNDWMLLDAADRSTVRAAHASGKRVYTAGDNNIGYWETKTTGEKTYTSLLGTINQMGIIGETFWSIGSQGNRIYFQSFGNIIWYDGQQAGYLVKQDFYSLLFPTNGKLFVQKFNYALMQIDDGKLFTFCSDPLFKNEEVRFVFQLSMEKYLIGFANGEIYTLSNNRLSLLIRLKNSNNTPVRIDCGSIWKNQLLAVGTIGDGAFLIRMNDLSQTHIHTPQLQDLNIHSICFVDDNFLWLSLDNGVSSVVLHPPMYLWKTNKEIGTFFDAAQFDGKTYVASNQGMYVYNESGYKLPLSIFPLQFCNLKNELLCGTTSALYKMKPGQPHMQRFCNVNGVEQFEYLADGGNEFIFMRAYSGISVLHYRKQSWHYLSSIAGTVNYTYIMPETRYTVWAIHPKKGIFRLRINNEITGISETDTFTEIDGYTNYSNTIIFKVEEQVLFATPRGIYRYDLAEKRFVKQQQLSNQIHNLNKLQSIRVASGNRVWVAANNELFLYRIADLTAELVVNIPFVQNEFTLYDKHLNLRSVNDSLTFISTCEGTVVINQNRTKKSINKNHSLLFESFCYTDREGATHFGNIQVPKLTLPHGASAITVRARTTLSALPEALSYRLLGSTDEWSEWHNSGMIHFANLPSGNYQLQIRDSSENLISLDIDAERPLYLRSWMILLYAIAFLLIVTGIVVQISEKRKKVLFQRYSEQLQQQQYEQLQEKVVAQENELKSRMRFLSQKQELLESISIEIEHQKNELGDRYPNKLHQRLMKIIQDGKTEKDKFLSFENYFVEVHYEFMLRIQSINPALSASELKFCCLLRANLSTKEIAVIMGIAPRSVELKKNRLKHKLGLEAGNSLGSYILSI